MSTTTYKALETSYNGYRFRSRLEARWAVFFDVLKIRYEYEPQGVMVHWRLEPSGSGGPSEWAYLPDFYLPDFGMWAEVKGDLDLPALWKLLNAAATLSSPRGGCGGGNDMLVLGPIPPYGPEPPYPFYLHMCKGSLYANPWWNQYPPGGCGLWSEVANDSRHLEPWIGDDPCRILRGKFGRSVAPTRGQKVWELNYKMALGVARKARFEHGETPRL